MTIALRYAARSDVGLVRPNNQDSAYAGPHLLVVADGMGGHAGGDIASSVAVAHLAPLDDEAHGPDDALDELAAALRAVPAVYGARLTGAGFGGCVVALTSGADAERIASDATSSYRRSTGLEPRAFPVRAVDGAGPITHP
ncbi:MAG: hypothetical protein ACXW1S_10380 [Acidimicrobiia bacterium]